MKKKLAPNIAAAMAIASALSPSAPANRPKRNIGTGKNHKADADKKKKRKAAKAARRKNRR